MERLKFIDESRGFAIILMVFGHIIAWNFPDWRQVVLLNNFQNSTTLIASVWWQLIYSFHMALLFMISGYTLSASTLWKSIKKKTTRLLVPYLFTGFIMLLIKDYFGYWFLLSLWILSIIGILCNHVYPLINKREYVIIDIALIILFYLLFSYLLKRINIQPFGDIGKTANYLLPYLLGIFFRRHKKIFDTLSKGFTIWLILFAALFILKYSPYWGYSGSVYGFFHTLNRHSLLAIIGSMMVLSFFQKGIPQKLSYYLSFIGKNSLEVYILHLLFAIQIPLIGAFWLSTNPITCITTQIVFAFIAGGIAISLSLVSAWVLKRSKFLSMILFGK